MGQVLFEPPNVKGWPGGREWINTSTLLVRYNTAIQLVGGLHGMLKEPDGVVCPASVRPKQIVDAWLERLLARPIDPKDRQTLLDALGSKPGRAGGAADGVFDCFDAGLPVVLNGWWVGLFVFV